MTVLTTQQAAQYAAAAGFTGDGLNTIVAIAHAESGLDTAARHVNSDAQSSVDRGILQINNYWHSEVSDSCAYDPACAFQSGYSISQNGTNFTPWSTYNSGAYRQYYQNLSGGSTGGTTGQTGKAWYDYPTTQGYHPPKEWGIDIGTPFGTPMTALYAGIVNFAGRTCWGQNCSNGSSGGEVSIVCNVPGLGTMTSYYLHLDRLAPGIISGAAVGAGQLIGYSGGQLSGGNWPVVNANGNVYSDGPHTEFGFNAPWVAGPGTNVDPTFAINQARSGQLGLPTNGYSPEGSTSAPSTPWPTAQFIQQGLLSFLGLAINTKQAVSRIEGYDGIAEDLDYMEQMQPMNLLNPIGSVMVNGQALFFRAMLIVAGLAMMYAVAHRLLDTPFVQNVILGPANDLRQSAQQVAEVAPEIAAVAV